MSKQVEDDFKKKVDCLFEFYNTFRTHAEQQRNMLRMKKQGIFHGEPFAPSDRTELEHLEKLVDLANDVFPFANPVSKCKEDILRYYQKSKIDWTDKLEPNTSEYEKKGVKSPRCKKCLHNNPDYISLGVNDKGIIKLKCVYCGDESEKD